MTTVRTMAQRSLAIVVTVLLFVGGWTLVLQPLYGLPVTAIERLNDTRFELARLQALASESGDLTADDVDRLEQSVAPLIFSSPKDGAAFVAAVDSLIRSANVQLLELRTADPTKVANLTRFTIDVRMTASEEALIGLLIAAERHRPLLLIERAVVTTTASMIDNSSTPVSAELRVSAFAGENDQPSDGEARAR
ncbi:type II secretion system protein GspM [Thauera sp. ZXT1-4]|uniref:type II secretion system protein GspM n=1 Tax=Thauera sp. ZXT1-4 TaxID=3460294 RepID=UPI004040896D